VTASHVIWLLRLGLPIPSWTTTKTFRAYAFGRVESLNSLKRPQDFARTREESPSYNHLWVPRSGKIDTCQVCSTIFVHFSRLLRRDDSRRVLTERHGYRIAVIMNEFGDTAVSFPRVWWRFRIWSDPLRTFRTLKVYSSNYRILRASSQASSKDDKRFFGLPTVRRVPRARKRVFVL
jgi:hypothetical protein